MKKFIYYGEKSSQCPVRLLEAWIRAAEIKEGAPFRRVNNGSRFGDRMSDKAVYNIVKDTTRKPTLTKGNLIAIVCALA